MEAFFIMTSIMFFSSVITKMCFTHRENVTRIRYGLPVIKTKGIALYGEDLDILSLKKGGKRKEYKRIKER